MKKVCDFCAVLVLISLVALNGDAFRLTSAYATCNADECDEVTGRGRRSNNGWIKIRWYNNTQARQEIRSTGPLGGNKITHTIEKVKIRFVCADFTPVGCVAFAQGKTYEGTVDSMMCQGSAQSPRVFCADNRQKGVEGSWNEDEDEKN